MTRSSFGLVVAAASVVVFAAAACTSSQNGAGEGAGVPLSTAVSSPSAPPSSASSSASATPTTPTPSKTAKPSKTKQPPPSSSQPPPSSSSPPPPPSSTAPPGPPWCTADQLKATGVIGGAYQGREVAGVVFTNSSSSTCSVRGYPFAQLRYQGRPLGKPASDNPGTVRTIVLKPGRSAQSQLTAVTTCQAPISDHVRVRVPNTDQPKIVPMQMRGCSLSIDPLQAS